MTSPSSPSSSLPFIVGVDISSQSFTVRLLANGSPLGSIVDFTNDSSGFKQLGLWLQEHGAHVSGTLIVMEATGVYWEECAFALHGAGFSIAFVNPAQIKAFGRTLLRRSKTDATDADLIARFASSVPLRCWQPPSLELEGLQLIMRQREAYLSMLLQETNRLHALERRPEVPRTVLEALKKHIAFLKKNIKDMENSFKKDLKGYPEWQQSLDLLLSIPGIGPITAATLITETRALETFVEARQLTAYAGIAPAPYSSGSSVHRPSSISKIGVPRLRRAFYMAALSATRMDSSPYRAFYLRLRDKGKPFKVAMIAVARKLMVLCFAVIRAQKPYDPNFNIATGVA